MCGIEREWFVIVQSKMHLDIHGGILLDVPDNPGIQLWIHVVAFEALSVASPLKLCECDLVHKWATQY
jgi:hypothetical protein